MKKEVLIKRQNNLLPLTNNEPKIVTVNAWILM